PPNGIKHIHPPLPLAAKALFAGRAPMFSSAVGVCRTLKFGLLPSTECGPLLKQSGFFGSPQASWHFRVQALAIKPLLFSHRAHLCYHPGSVSMAFGLAHGQWTAAVSGRPTS